MIPFVCFALWALLCSFTAAGSEVSFSREIAPLLARKCLACHDAEKKKGGYQVQSYEALLKAGKSKLTPVEPGEPDKSELFHRITISDPDDRMPQKDDPLPADSIALIRDWISQGAKFDGPDKAASLASLIPSSYPAPPEHYAHPVAVLSLAFNKDGSELAIGGYHEILIWSPAKSIFTERLTNVARRIHALAWNTENSELWAATGTPGVAGEVVIFDAKGLVPKERLARINDEMLALTFSPDGSTVAAGGADNAIHIIDAKSHKERLSINQHADWVTALSFSPDGKHLASASRDRTARIYSTENGNLETTYTGHSSAVYAVAFARDGKDVFSGGRDKSIHIWKSDDAREAGKLSDPGGDVYLLLAHEDALFCASADGVIREFAIGDRKLRRSFTGHADSAYALSGNWTGQVLASGSYDGMVKLWNLSSGTELKSFLAAP